MLGLGVEAGLGMEGGTPNPPKLDPPNPVEADGFEKADPIAAVPPAPTSYPSCGLGGGLPKANPTGFPKVPLFPDPKPAKPDVGVAAEEPPKANGFV